MKILVVDDDAASRRRLQGLLAKTGHEPITARDGSEAWQILGRQEIPLVITDWIMPRVDGLALCRSIRGQRHAKYTYIILIPVLSGKVSYLEGIAAGADDFLSKPYDPDVLSARLRVATRLLDLRAEVRRLQGLLPICQYCKKIRDDRNLWTQIEAYISDHSEADFSHGICPECEQIHVVPQLRALERELERQGRL